MPVAAGTWVFNGTDSPFSVLGTLRKQVDDYLWFEFDLGNVPEIMAGETIVDAVVTIIDSKRSLEVGDPDPTDHLVGMYISAGQSGETYLLLCQVTTSGGAVIARIGELMVL